MTNKRLKMPFGKYRGRAFPNIPSDYLRWLVEQDWVTEEIQDEAITVLEDRDDYREKLQLRKKVC